MSVTISLSASVTIACLFSPKVSRIFFQCDSQSETFPLIPSLQLYIILIRPERNVRQSMMPMRYSAITKSTGSGSHGGSMMAHLMVTAATCDSKQQVQKCMQRPCDLDERDGENLIIYKIIILRNRI